jgi:S-adenosylmethionine/arginine decarboxylase-like enzyme
MNTISSVGSESLQVEFLRTGAWGLSTAVDLLGCTPETIRSAEEIARYVVELCELIEMRRFGETTIVRFGDDPKVSGYSFTQLIETSLISGHFAEQTDAAYLDIFSCKFYDPDAVAEFSKRFFGAQSCRVQVQLR